MASLKPLIMRSNRLLGANLVEKNLVSIDALDEANERLLELVSSGSSDLRVSLLSVLIKEKNRLKEKDLFNHFVEEERLGLIDLATINFTDEVVEKINEGECWATWTVPFDLIEGTHYLASAYYLSSAVRKHWEDKLKGHVVWYAASIDSISDALEKMEGKRAQKSLAAN